MNGEGLPPCPACDEDIQVGDEIVLTTTYAGPEAEIKIRGVHLACLMSKKKIQALQDRIRQAESRAYDYTPMHAAGWPDRR